MECDKNGRKHTLLAAGIKRKCRSGGPGGLQQAYTSAVPDAFPSSPMRVNLVSHCPPESISNDHKPSDPFMNNMDEISYWIYTKRAPCLLHYDNDIKRRMEQAHCSKTKPESLQSTCEEVPPKKKKRKLKLLNDDSSSEKQQNVYFETPQQQKPGTSKSDAVSNLDFNIKHSPQNTSKKTKLQKSCQTSQKKKRITSTPKVPNLRRSLRRAQQNNNSELNHSCQVFNATILNGKTVGEHSKTQKESDGAHIDKNHSKQSITDKKKNVLNGQFEDLSDVSGFTANYIRSTKIQSSKSPKKLRNKNNRSLVKDTQDASTEEKVVVCVNKSINAVDGVVSCSTDSSQNVLNLFTVKDNNKSNKNNKSTSMLKIVDSKLEKNHKIENDRKGNLNVSFQSKSSGNSRYPKRHQNDTIEDQSCSNVNTSMPARYSTRKSKVKHSARKENAEGKTPRTRSERKTVTKLDFSVTKHSVLNNSSDQLSSSALNVASPRRGRRPNTSTRCLRSRRNKTGRASKDSSECGKQIHSKSKGKKSLDKTVRRDSLRDKSGFTACFSDSDSDSEPLLHKKFFC